MFKGQYFYHQHIRKAIIAFGTLFNNIQLRRSDENGDVLQSIFVPLSYAPKQKFIDRIREAPELGVKNDLQIILDSVSYQDEWEGNFDKRLSVIWDLNFTMKLNFFGYVYDTNLIKTVIQNIYADNTLAPGTTPTNTQVGTRITTTVDPTTASPLDDYSFIQEFDEIYTGE